MLCAAEQVGKSKNNWLLANCYFFKSQITNRQSPITNALWELISFKEDKMAKNSEKTILRDSGNGRFISRRQAASKPRNTWQEEQVPARNPKQQSPDRRH
jgi:hypothetical protein